MFKNQNKKQIIVRKSFHNKRTRCPYCGWHKNASYLPKEMTDNLELKKQLMDMLQDSYKDFTPPYTQKDTATAKQALVAFYNNLLKLNADKSYSGFTACGNMHFAFMPDMMELAFAMDKSYFVQACHTIIGILHKFPLQQGRILHSLREILKPLTIDNTK